MHNNDIVPTGTLAVRIRSSLRLWDIEVVRPRLYPWAGGYVNVTLDYQNDYHQHWSYPLPSAYTVQFHD